MSTAMNMQIIINQHVMQQSIHNQNIMQNNSITMSMSPFLQNTVASNARVSKLAAPI